MLLKLTQFPKIIYSMWIIQLYPKVFEEKDLSL